MVKSLLHRPNLAVWVCAIGLGTLGMTQTTTSVQAESSQPPVEQVPQDQASKGSSVVASQDADTAPSVSLVRTLDEPGVQELGGRGRVFSDDFDWLRWGPLGVRSAEVLYTHSSADSGVGSENLSATTFQANVAFNKRLRRSRLILQYSPRLLIVDGSVMKDLSNQDSTLDLIFAPTQRWTMGVTDWFSFYGRNNTLSDRSLNRNNFSGAIMNPFLSSGQRTLLDSIAFPVSYNTSARTSISVAPFFGYGRTETSDSNVAASPGEPSALTTFQYGARTQVIHILSANQSIGAFYNYQLMQQGRDGETIPFQAFGASFSRRVGRSLGVSGELGGSRAAQPQFTTWTGVGSITVNTYFRHSSLQATYGRDATFSGFLGNGYNDYAWANYSREVSRKARIGAGFGYLSGPSLGRTARGQYVNCTVSYVLGPSVSWFFSYVRFWQQGAGTQVGQGGQSQLQVGLRWSQTRKAGF